MTVLKSSSAGFSAPAAFFKKSNAEEVFARNASIPPAPERSGGSTVTVDSNTSGKVFEYRNNTAAPITAETASSFRLERICTQNDVDFVDEFLLDIEGKLFNEKEYTSGDRQDLGCDGSDRLKIFPEFRTGLRYNDHISRRNAIRALTA